MKQLIFLLLFPCFALAQYQGNANQKITLGEQTTADGLVFRGVASIDTVTATSKITRANKQDTSAYILLDTVTNLLWHYKIGSNAWTQAGGSTLDTATMLLPYYRAGRNTIIQTADVPTLNQNTTGSAATLTTGRTIQTNLASTSAATFNGSANITPGVTGTLPVANGGTGSTTKNFVDLTTTQSIGGPKTFSSLLTAGGDININMPNSTNRYLSWYSANGLYQVAAISSITDPSYNDAGILIFSTARTSSAGFTEKMRITPNGNVGIGTTSPQSGYRLHVVDSVYVGGNVSASAYTTRSDYDLKDEIQNINYGINEVMQMQPVKYTYKSNGSTQLGFIAQDLGVITPEVVSFEDKMSVYYNALIPILTKAIQEQQALIKALEQRIITLENK